MLATDVRVSSSPAVAKSVDGSTGSTKFSLPPTPEGPFYEGNDLSAARCKSILRSEVAQPV